MCGLVGVAGNLAFKDEALMKRLLLLDVFRGADSTGLASVRTSGDVKIAKVASHPLDFFDMGKFKDTLNGTMSRVFMGHNRAATRGVINTANAHPFQYEHITGAHNGTLDWASAKALEKELKEEFPVDSQALIAAIAKFGLKDAMSLAAGAWSLVWYDQKERSLNFLRNKDRPMWHAWDKDFERLLWASEYPMIDAAIRLGGSSHELFRNTEGHSFFATEVDVHYKFDVDELRKANKKERVKPVVRTIKGKETVPYRAPNSYTPFEREPAANSSNVVTLTGAANGNNSGTSQGRGKSSRGTNGTNKPTIVHLLGDLRSPLGGVITQERFNEMASAGCGWCQGDVNYGDIGVTVYDRDDLVLCADCSPHHSNADSDPSTRIYARVLPTIN